MKRYHRIKEEQRKTSINADASEYKQDIIDFSSAVVFYDCESSGDEAKIHPFEVEINGQDSGCNFCLCILF